MKLQNESLQWIYDNCERMQRAVVALDYCKSSGVRRMENKLYDKVDNEVCDLALSFLWLAIGEAIPKTLWSVDDYSELYGIITQAHDDGQINLSNDD